MADDNLLDAELTGLDRRLRELEPDDLDTFEPPASVWEGIERSLASDDAVVEPHAEQLAAPVPIDAARRRRPPMRGRSTSWLLGLAAAMVLAVAGAVVVAQQSSDSETVATAVLGFEDGFDQLGASASATAEVTDDGTVVIVSSDLPDLIGDADLELWLIEPATDGSVADLVSLGTIDGDRFVIPDGYDTERFSVVDISVEPRDGDPAHSGRSILRGSLDA